MPDVLQPDNGSVIRSLQNDVLEFRRFSQPSHCAYADFKSLVRWCGRLSYSPSGYLNVLFGKRADYIASCELATSHAHWIEPYTHCVLALTKDEYLSNSFYALESVAHVNIEIVADEKAVVPIVFGVKAGSEDEVVGRFYYTYAGGLYFVRHAAKSLIHAVLHVHGSKVDVTIEIEDNADAAAAVVAAR